MSVMRCIASFQDRIADPPVSGGANGDCVQVAPAPDRVLMGDSKDAEGPALAVPVPAWRSFLRTPIR